jgi:hypothetical protein
MSGSVVSAVTNSFSLPLTAPILAVGRARWGILESVQPAGEGLLLVKIGGEERLVDEELLDILRPLVGKTVTVTHPKTGQWGAGGLGNVP